jgi:flagellar hook protein FlgE
MGVSSALYSGVSGLNANANAMSVLGDNLANANTVGFKSSRTIFGDLLSSQVSGSGGTSQVGRGVGLSTVDTIFSQGTFENTETNTDLAIEGSGFLSSATHQPAMLPIISPVPEHFALMPRDFWSTPKGTILWGTSWIPRAILLAT